MKKTGLAVPVIAATLISAAIACGAPGVSLPPAPTPTGTVIVGQENQTPAEPTGLPPADAEATCLKTAAGAIDVGDPCVLGTYYAHWDTIERPSDHQTIDTDSRVHADMTLWAVSVGKLQGYAHLTYALKSTEKDSEAKSCATQTEIVAPFGWDVQLNGQFFTLPDGSIQFIIQATPAKGPGYVEGFPDCPIPARPVDGIYWGAVTGKFVQGSYHVDIDSPLPANSTGRIDTEIWIVVVK